jgi:hypothetical protein
LLNNSQEVILPDTGKYSLSACLAVPEGPSTKANLETIRKIEAELEAMGIPLHIVPVSPPCPPDSSG